MIIDLEPFPAAPATSSRCNLVLHCGAQRVNRSDLAQAVTPPPTRTWQPVPHLSVLQQVEAALQAVGLETAAQAHSLSHGGNRYFGLLEMAGGSGDHAWVLGIRNSHDKTFPAGLVAGAQVFVCDNLSFSGEVSFARKHTRYILRDLPSLTATAIGRLMEKWHIQETRIHAYRDCRLNDRQVHDLVIRAVDAGACANQSIPGVLQHWREPAHAVFRERNAWSLFNAFTEALKGNLVRLPTRTQILHGLFDHQVGLAVAEGER